MCIRDRHEDILQKLEPCENEKIISVIQCLNVRFTRLLIENVANNILDAVFDGDFFVLNQEMIQTIVWYKKSSMVGDLTTRPYSTLIALKYLPLLQYVQDNIELYVREVVLTNEVLKDNAEDIIDLLRLSLIHIYFLLKGSCLLSEQKYYIFPEQK